MRQQPPREFTLVDLARAFNVAAHTAVNQKRKYTGEDYHVHPEEVLQILLTFCDPSFELQAAALLHDVIEDTATTRNHIAQVFGQQVAKYVVEVSDVSRPEDGNRKIRKAMDCAHLANASYEAKELKCADLISNGRSITKHDQAFARVFVDEALAILKAFESCMIGTLIYMEALDVCFEAVDVLYSTDGERYKVLSRHWPDTTFEQYLEHKG